MHGQRDGPRLIRGARVRHVAGRHRTALVCGDGEAGLLGKLGIADGVRINTDITLPVGIEAYGAYALYAWIGGKGSEATKTFARRSAIGALVLGCLGQVAFHLGASLAAARKDRGWSLREAERRSGVPNAHISQIETGAIERPGIAILVRLAEAYGIPEADLLAAAGWGAFLRRSSAAIDEQRGLSAAESLRKLARTYVWYGGDVSVHVHSGEYDLRGVVIMPERADDCQASTRRRLLLEHAEGLVDAVTASGWKLADDVRLSFRTGVAKRTGWQEETSLTVDLRLTAPEAAP